MSADCFYPPELVGLNTSGMKRIPADGTIQPILTGQQPPRYPQGCEGMATVHVTTRSSEIVPPPAGANSKILLTVGWGSGLASMEVRCEGSRGAVLALAAREAVTVRAQMISSVAGEELVPGFEYEVGVVVKWFTSGTGFEPMLAFPAIPVPARPAFSAFVRIPAQARRMRVLIDNPTGYATLSTAFRSLAAGPTRYESDFGSGWTPVVNGVEWAAIRCGIAVLATPIFELWP